MSTPHPLETVTKIPTLRARDPHAHKGRTGHVAIIAGSRGMTGAAVLSGRGALRGGAGLVRIYTPASAQTIIATAEPCLMTIALPEDEHGRLTNHTTDEATSALNWADVMAIGPGLGQSDAVTNTVREVVRSCERSLVADADALNALAQCGEWWKNRAGGPLVLTPHPGEMNRMLAAANLPALNDDRDAARIAAAGALAKLTSAVVVLKGHRTVVADAARVFINETGNAGMATGGMGDVLTGLIAALVGQGVAPFEAAQLGVYCHGAAADALVDAVGPVGYLASEVADAIPATLGLQIRT